MLVYNSFDDLMCALACSQRKCECEEPFHVPCFVSSLEKTKD